MNECKACGVSFNVEEPSWRYVAQGEDHKHRAEHMQRRCRRCGFSWRELCKFSGPPASQPEA